MHNYLRTTCWYKDEAWHFLDSSFSIPNQIQTQNAMRTVGRELLGCHHFFLICSCTKVAAFEKHRWLIWLLVLKQFALRSSNIFYCLSAPEPMSVPQVVRSSQQSSLIPALRNSWDHSGHMCHLSGPALPFWAFRNRLRNLESSLVESKS